ncbi:ABC transporter ATP-binding protein [Microvirga sp. Mcv34]|uniref:ABC transporter ATP-binding protein n=1 Tax=Microvirga sp. Mcv34 TaxID=2926016 RepID=UPI0021C72689|nr:ABC transporter ATP-binding protein [Microvirga sp. Mcv34]
MTLVLDGVSKKVGAATHIDDVHLNLERGSLNVLLGATLAGKTSLMRLMAGLDAPTSGRILVDGQDVTGWPVQRRSVAMVYQQFINYPSLDVYENIASPLRVARLPKAEIDARVREAAKLLKLEPYLDRKPLNLSGGQQQRTAIARALVKRADLVLLDEPLANLDYKLREELREELPRVFAASGAVFVYATTEPSEALLLGGNTATLFQGRVTQFGPTPQVYRRPDDLITARVFSDPPLNTMTVRKSGGSAILSTGAEINATGPLASVADGEYTIGFRAHHLTLEPTGPDGISIPAIVSVSEITGSESYVHLDASEHRLVALIPGVRRLEPKSPVTVHIDPRHLFLFNMAGRLAVTDPAQKAA